MYRKPLLLALFCLVWLLTACTSPVTQQPTTAPITKPGPTQAIATAAPTGALVPTTVPTMAVPEVAGILPRPLYLLSNQIVRLEAADLAQREVTNEVPALRDMAPISVMTVSPADGSLAYVVQRDLANNLLVRAGAQGEDPRPIFERPGVFIAEPQFSPDGRQLAVTLQGATALISGIYLIPAEGGEPRLLVANDVIQDMTQFDPNLRSFIPAGFSPDGRKLLVYQGYAQMEGCDLAVVNLADGTVTPLAFTSDIAGELIYACNNSFTWTLDSSTLYFTPIRIGAPLGHPTLYRADVATGTVTALTSAQDLTGPLTLYSHPYMLADGTILVLTAEVASLPPSFSDEPTDLAYGIARLDPATRILENLRTVEPVDGRLNQAVWAPGGAGLAAYHYDHQGVSRVLFMASLAGDAVIITLDSGPIFGFAWGI